jgi:transposase
MKKNHILGRDIAQNSAVAQLDRADGTRCWHETLTTDQAGWQQLEKLRLAHGAQWADTCVLLEATGVYHLPWAERLHTAGAEVYVLNPLLAARLHSAANALRGHKTDRVDVHRLCESGRLYADQLARFRYRPEAARQGLKQLTSARARLRTTLTNLKKSLHSHLELVFPALLAAKLDPASARVAAILAAAPTAGAWRALPEAERRKLAGDKSPALDQTSANTLAEETLATACAPAMHALLAAQQALVTELNACDAQIAPQLPAAKVALIKSLPGFGPRTAAVLAAYLPASFDGWGKPKQITARLQAYVGMDPRLKQSGNWIGQIKLSKRGIGAARTALYQAAFCSLKKDPENYAYYRGLRARGKRHKQAMVDLMRKQLRRLVSVLLSSKPYVPRNALSP